MKNKLFLLILLLSVFSVSTLPATAAVSSNVVRSEANDFNFLRAHRQGSGVALSWSAPIQGVDHFRIERSYDGEFFDEVTCVAALSGTNKFLDNEAFPGTIYYRIAAVVAAGDATYSPVVSVRLVRRG